MKALHLFIALLYCNIAPMSSVGQLPTIVINEILFNPLPGGVDYVEIYNRSSAPVDLNGWRIANRSSTGAISSSKILSGRQKQIAPGGYLVITEDTAVVQKQFYVKDTSAFLTISSMPSYPDAAGTVILLDQQNNVIDELQYSSKWHFTLISNPEGVSLERINPDKPTQDPNNWHSASTSSGYGTPGYRNSQYLTISFPENAITIEPRIFSPDRDGYNDYVLIKYKFSEPGYMCNITLFNINGIPVRHLVRNGLCGIEGYYKWDGLNDTGDRLNTGSYIILTEVFNLNGKTIKNKQLVTLARRI